MQRRTSGDNQGYRSWQRNCQHASPATNHLLPALLRYPEAFSLSPTPPRAVCKELVCTDDSPIACFSQGVIRPRPSECTLPGSSVELCLFVCYAYYCAAAKTSGELKVNVLALKLSLQGFSFGVKADLRALLTKVWTSTSGTADENQT